VVEKRGGFQDLGRQVHGGGENKREVDWKHIPTTVHYLPGAAVKLGHWVSKGSSESTSKLMGRHGEDNNLLLLQVI